MNLKCISLNIRGINKSIKRRNLFRWLHNGKCDVIFLQETYSDKDIENVWRSEWGGDVFYSHGSKHSRGVMTLIKPTLKIENPEITSDKNGRFLIVHTTLRDEEYCFANIYAPNDPSLQKAFFNELANKLRPYSNVNIILGGDFNCPLESVDKTGGKDINDRRNVIDSINDLRNNLNLVDIWRLHHPTSQCFTWRNSSGKIQCRLDYWLVTKHLVSLASKTEIKAYHDSDHSPIYVEIKHENAQTKRGPGFWKFNNSLLENEEFVLKLKFFLIHAKEKHSNTKDKRLFWEMIKMEIRDFCIRFTKRLSKNKRSQEMNLLRKLNELNIRHGQNPNDMNLTDEVGSVKLQLKKISEHKTKGAIIRSRVRWYEHGERNNKYFTNLEKRAHDKKHIAKLKTGEDEYLEEPNQILSEMENFYETLYTSQLPQDSQIFDNSCKPFLNSENIPKLNADQQNTCEGLISANECLEILKTFAKNKTPGSDGLTAEFYVCFWDEVSSPLINCFNDAYQTGEMSITQRRGVISLIPKKNKDKLLLKNWRPISLLNTDYKIATKCIAKRLEKVLPSLIHRDQTGYVKNRFIGENIRLISDVIDLYEKRNLPGMLFFIDFEKAFDSLEWRYLFEVLKAMNFGPMFQNWIRVFYSNISSCVVNNGHASNFFSLFRGVRQGCPLSGLLFVLAIETLAQLIRQNENIRGLKINDTEIKLSLYADDITAFIHDDDSAGHLFNILDKFGVCSGLKINISKTEGMWLGSLKHNLGKRSPYNISWPEKYVISLGVAFAYDPTVSDRINFEEKLVSLKKILNQWSTRNLTLIGRICIVKTLAISKLVYNTSVLAVPSNICKQARDICFKFVWKFKPDKIKRHSLIAPFDKGGLNMVDFVLMDKSLKAAWVKRLCEAGDSKWCATFSSFTSHHGGTLLFESNFDINDLNLAPEFPSFYKEILVAWQEIHSTEPSSVDEYENEIIWNNRFIKIGGKSVFFPSWHRKGVVKIKDLLSEDRKFLSRIAFEEKYGLRVNFLQYHSLLAAIPSIWKRSLPDPPQTNEVTKNNISPSTVTAKHAREHFVFKTLKPPNNEQDLSEKNLPLKAIYELPFKVTIENKLRCFQFKIIHNILPSNQSLFKMGKKTSPRCEHCFSPNETLTHMLYECPTVQKFWREIITWWNELRSEKISLNETDILYGYKPDSSNFYALNHVLITAKHHIFQFWLQNTPPSFSNFLSILKDKILCENKIAFKNNTLSKFKSKWTTLCALTPSYNV